MDLGFCSAAENGYRFPCLYHSCRMDNKDSQLFTVEDMVAHILDHHLAGGAIQCSFCLCPFPREQFGKGLYITHLRTFHRRYVAAEEAQLQNTEWPFADKAPRCNGFVPLLMPPLTQWVRLSLIQAMLLLHFHDCQAKWVGRLPRRRIRDLLHPAHDPEYIWQFWLHRICQAQRVVPPHLDTSAMATWQVEKCKEAKRVLRAPRHWLCSNLQDHSSAYWVEMLDGEDPAQSRDLRYDRNDRSSSRSAVSSRGPSISDSRSSSARPIRGRTPTSPPDEGNSSLLTCGQAPPLSSLTSQGSQAYSPTCGLLSMMGAAPVASPFPSDAESSAERPPNASPAPIGSERRHIRARHPISYSEAMIRAPGTPSIRPPGPRATPSPHLLTTALQRLDYCFPKTVDQNRNIATIRLALQLVPGLNTDPSMLNYCLFATSTDYYIMDNALQMAVELSRIWKDRLSTPEK